MRISQQIRIVVALGLVLILALAGCTKTTRTPTATSTGPSGELKVALSTFGPETFYGPSFVAAEYYQAPMTEYLVRLGDPSGKQNTGIAESWEAAPDGLSLTFHIRKGIHFDNGEDLKADDVKFTLDRYALPSANFPFVRDAQDRVEVLDDYTVRVYTKGVQVYYPQIVSYPSNTGQGVILPKDYFESVGLEKYNLHPVGAGPFKLVKLVPSDSAEYEAVENHWRQTPAFKKLSVVMISEESTKSAMLRTGALDAAAFGLDESAALEKAGFRTVNLATSQRMVVLFGSYDPRAKGMPIANVKVRQALSLAINREEIGRTLYYGKLGSPTLASLWPDQPEVDASYWTKTWKQFYRYDPEGAKRLLKEAGYAGGFPIKIYSFPMGGAPDLPKLAEVIQGYWRNVGVKAELVPSDWGSFAGWRRSGPDKGPADQLVGQVSMRSAEGGAQAGPQLSILFGSAGWNLVQGAVPELDEAIKESSSIPDQKKRAEAIAKAMQLAMDTNTHAAIGPLPILLGLGPKLDVDFKVRVQSATMYSEFIMHRPQ